MRHGFVVPFADAREFAEVAALGEQHRWDAVFTWKSLYGEHAWVTLAAAAMRTSRIRLGTLLTPASRHRPWDLATTVSAVDRLSGGRVVMSVGLGALHPGWTRFEPDEGRAVRAAKLDESLAVYRGLLSGEPFTFDGVHYPVGPEGDGVPPAPPRPPTGGPRSVRPGGSRAGGASSRDLRDSPRSAAGCRQDHRTRSRSCRRSRPGRR